MPQLRTLSDCLVSGAHASAGEVIDASEADAEILIGCGRAEAVEAEATPAAATSKPTSNTPRTKAQIAADLAAAKEAEARLQADLSQATE